ncbi:MAG TPA: nucleotide exchange factor GrpE [Candidatus Hypogeohydataceae bacterium YC41]
MTEKEKVGSGQSESEGKGFPEGSALSEAEEGATEVKPAPEAELPAEKKVELTEKELAELRKKAEERDEYMDLLLRTRADFSNYQKRMKREMEMMGRYATQELVKALIPALDHLSRAIKSAEATNSENLKKFLDGLQLIQNEFLKAMETAGVKKIEAATGQPFNPELHEAFLEEENAELPHHTVLEPLEPGFVLHDRVLKPAIVKVSRRPTPPEEKQEVPSPQKEAPKESLAGEEEKKPAS